MRSGDARIAQADGAGAPALLLPVRGRALAEPAADRSLAGLGIDAERVGRWARGVDLDLYDPAQRDPEAYPGEVKVLYAGRLTSEKGVDLLAESFLRRPPARSAPAPSLAGGGPEEDALRGAPGRAGDLPRLARPRAARAGLRERRRVPVLLAHGHLRPGDRRGAGERPAVVAVDEGGPGDADRRAAHRLALPRPTPRRWPRPSPSSPPRRSCASGSPAALASSPARRGPGTRAFEQLAAGYGVALGAARKPRAAPQVLRPPDGRGRLAWHLEESWSRQTSRPAAARRPRTAPAAPVEADRPDLEDSSPLLQPRALLARLQRPRPPARRGPSVPLLERVKFARSGSRTSTSCSWSGSPTSRTRSRPGRRRRPPTGCPRPISSTRSASGSLGQRSAARRDASNASLRPALAEHGIRIITPEQATAEERAELDQLFERQVFPVLTPLVIGRGRPFPYISNLSLSLAVVLRDPGEGQRDPRPRQGAEGAPAAASSPSATTGETLVPLEALIAANLGVAVPGHGGARPLAVPGHPRHRLRRLRRGRRPAAGGRGGASPPALRRGGAARDRRRHERPPARAADRRRSALEDDEVYEVDGLLDLGDLWDVVGRPRPRRAARPAAHAR